MIAIVINQKIVLVRHWLKWYKVQRGFEDWKPLPIGRRYVKKPELEKIISSLNKEENALMSKNAADDIANAVLKKHRTQKKGKL